MRARLRRIAEQQPQRAAFKRLRQGNKLKVMDAAASVLDAEDVAAVGDPSAVGDVCQAGAEGILGKQKLGPTLPHAVGNEVELAVGSSETRSATGHGE